MSTREGIGEANGRRRMSRGALAWLGIVAAIGVVQLFRRQWGDAAIFGGAAALIAAEALGMLRLGDRLRRPPRVALLVAGTIAAIVLTIVPRHSVWAGLVVALLGAAAVGAAWAPPRESQHTERPWPPALRRLGWAWAAVVVAACLWELTQVTLGGTTPGGRRTHPALSDLLDPLVGAPFGQAVFAVCWLAMGLLLVTRGARR